MNNNQAETITTQIPALLPDGFLPPGIHLTTWEEFEQRYSWSMTRRTQLKGMKKALDEFKRAGCSKIYIDGSFVTGRNHPGDFDALYDLDELIVDSIDKVLIDSSFSGREKQKKNYEGEFFPASAKADPYGNKYLDFFQKQKKNKKPKGIIKIELR
ncbi:hypothetical protein ABGV42_14985 [Paenibacillus pabuli]|uniref:DUF6932 family protein n=1 Tax=Paenibacillus pabuli TaxID=1472 RepID=UPI0032425E2B